MTKDFTTLEQTHAEREKQISDQCQAVDYLACRLAEIFRDRALRFLQKPVYATAAGRVEGMRAPEHLDWAGKESHEVLEWLRNFLHEQDGLDEKDAEGISRIIERARSMFPIEEVRKTAA